MHDNTGAIKAMEYLIGEMKADRLKILNVQSSAPVKEVNRIPFQDFREFEPTGEYWMTFHFASTPKQ